MNPPREQTRPPIVLSASTTTLISLAIVLSSLVGVVAGSGHLSYVLLLMAGALFLVLLRLGRQIRHAVFLALPLVAILQIPVLNLPLNAPPVTAILVVPFIEELWLMSSRRRGNPWRAVDLLQDAPVAIFAFGGLITALREHEGSYWYIAGLTPLLLFMVSGRLIQNAQDVWRTTRMIVVALLGYFLIILVGNTWGTVTAVNPANYGFEWRWLGFGQNIFVGPVAYMNVWPVTIATGAGLGFVLAVSLILKKNESPGWLCLYAGSLIVFVTIFARTGARGASIAAVIAISSMLVLAGRRSLGLATMALLVAGLLWAWRDVILSGLPLQTVERFLQFGNGPLAVTDFSYRLSTFSRSIRDTLQYPLGLGYSYPWMHLHVDEPIVYAQVLHGAGLLGAIGYSLLLLQFLTRFLISLFRQQDTTEHFLSIVGLGVWLYGVLAGLASERLLLDPVLSILYFAALVALYRAAPMRPGSSRKPRMGG